MLAQPAQRPPPEEWLGAAIGALAPLPPVLPPGLPARLVLDNLETVLEPGATMACYRAGYEGYGEVPRQVAESKHQSALLLTGREAPPELALLAGVAPMRTLHLGALDLAARRAMLQDKELVGDDDIWQALVGRYGGMRRRLANGGDDGAIRLWEAGSGACLRTLRSDRRHERLDITGLSGVTEVQRAVLLALGAIEQARASSGAPALAD